MEKKRIISKNDVDLYFYCRSVLNRPIFSIEISIENSCFHCNCCDYDCNFSTIVVDKQQLNEFKTQTKNNKQNE